MAIRRIYPDKDASIGSKPLLPEVEIYGNEGGDEVLEIGQFKDQYGTIQEKRILIKFPNTEIQEVLSQISGSLLATLHFKHCSVRGILRPRLFRLSNIAGEWKEGVGKKYKIDKGYRSTDYVFQEKDYVEEDAQEYLLTALETEGVNWKSRTGREGDEWVTAGGDVTEEHILTQYPTSEHDLDLSIDVTNLIGTSVEGFLLQIEEEYVGESYLHHFYSRQTHTVSRPYLEIGWRDQKWENTFEYLPQGKDYTIESNIQDLNITPDLEYKFYISPKVKYPTRVFSTSSLYLQNYSLPSSSVWRVWDETANKALVDFHPEHTLIHSDESGNYITFHSSFLEPERYYRVEVKVEEGNTFRIKNVGVPFKLK